MDVLLDHDDEASGYATCVDAYLWASLERRPEKRHGGERLHMGRPGRLLTLGKGPPRPPCPRAETKSLRITPDAIRSTPASADWGGREFIGLFYKDAVSNFPPEDSYGRVIAESELAIEFLCFATWAPIDEEKS